MPRSREGLPKYVHRYEHESFIGYRVKVQIKGVVNIQEYFSSKAAGGETLARRNACRRGRELERQYPVPVRAESGVRGVNRTRTSHVARWTDPEHDIRGSVAFGPGRRAKAHAAKARKRAMALKAAGKSTAPALRDARRAAAKMRAVA